jgi:hypothetical protein
LGVSSTAIFVWLAPTIVGVPGLMLWQRYYRRRFAAPARATASAGELP